MNKRNWAWLLGKKGEGMGGCENGYSMKKKHKKKNTKATMLASSTSWCQSLLQHRISSLQRTIKWKKLFLEKLLNFSRKITGKSQRVFRPENSLQKNQKTTSQETKLVFLEENSWCEMFILSGPLPPSSSSNCCVSVSYLYQCINESV